jgi:hypothetical protein
VKNKSRSKLIALFGPCSTSTTSTTSTSNSTSKSSDAVQLTDSALNLICNNFTLIADVIRVVGKRPADATQWAKLMEARLPDLSGPSKVCLVDALSCAPMIKVVAVQNLICQIFKAHTGEALFHFKDQLDTVAQKNMPELVFTSITEISLQEALLTYFKTQANALIAVPVRCAFPPHTVILEDDIGSHACSLEAFACL